MKNDMIKITGVLLLCFSLLSGSVIYASGADTLPEYLEIGLFFRGSSKSTVTLKVETGFEIYQHTATGTQLLTQMLDTSALILRKDAYYLGSGGNYVEYTGPIQETVGQLTLQGPFHLQMGETFSALAHAQAYLEGLNQLEEQPYLVYEGGWKIFYGLFISEEAANEHKKELEGLGAGEVAVAEPSPTRVQVMNQQGVPVLMYDSRETIYFRAFEEKGSIPLINVEGNHYRGEITAKRNASSDMAVVNKLLMEEYLYGVVPKEMPASWHREALKAQAIAARGYAITTMGKYTADEFDLCNTVSSQVYGGYDAENSATNQAVDATQGMIVTYQGEPITPFFHSNSGGQTESSENIWSNPLPYIRGVKDEYSLETPNSTWSKSMTLAELTGILEKNAINVGEIKSIRATEVSANGRIQVLVIEGTQGQEVLEKEASRVLFGLRSSWFEVTRQGEGSLFVQSAQSETPKQMDPSGLFILSAQGTEKIENTSDLKIHNGENYEEIQTTTEGFLFEGRGYGHGLGMSQHGANVMAEQGFPFDKILKHYYTGIEVETR